MFEVGWTEMLVIAIVMIVVVGPKDLPNMLRTFGRTTAKLRAMASDFQRQFNDALKEAELDDVKKSVDSLRSLNPAAEIRKQLNPFEQAAADVRSGVDAVMKPKPAVEAASTEQAAEPLKNGATTMPGVSPPEPTPATPIFPAMTDESVVAPAVEAQTTAAAVPQKAPAAKKKPAPAKAAAAVPAKPAKAAAPKVATKPEPIAQSSAAKKPAAAAKKPAAATKKPAATKTAGAAK
ncbi:Sec-independent protein translocase protein TatB [Mesorhizobium sp. M0400]|uniref:Sec-independent protein translocase protein TatB n=1 Tax=Mesorhizobium sp. M0400 TaxID=2956941 RepID=UPI00333A572D